MWNFITTNRFKATAIGEPSKWAASLLVAALSLMILGLYPSTDIFWAKCLVAEWLLVIFVVLIFFKDKWLKLFVILCMFQYIRTIGISGLARTTGWVTFTYILFFCIIYHVLLLKIRKVDTKKIINGICTIMLVQLAFMWLQYFKIDPLFGLSSIYEQYPSRLTTDNLVTAFWGHTNISGASLAITLPLFFRKNWRLAIIPIVWMIVLTQSLGAIIAAGAGIFFYLCCNKKVTKKVFITAMIALMAGVLMYGVKVDSKQLSLDNSRTHIFKMTWKLIERHPWKGYGLGQYKLAFKAIARGVFKVPQPSTQAHFDFLEVLVDTGIPGGVLVLGFLASLAIYFFRNMTPLSLLAMTGVVTGLVNSCSTFVFFTPLAWVILVLIVVIRKEKKPCL